MWRLFRFSHIDWCWCVCWLCVCVHHESVILIGEERLPWRLVKALMHRTRIWNRWFPRWAESATIIFSSCHYFKTVQVFDAGRPANVATEGSGRKWQGKTSHWWTHWSESRNIMRHILRTGGATLSLPGNTSIPIFKCLIHASVCTRYYCWLTVGGMSIWVLAQVNLISAVLFVLWSGLLAHLNTHVAASLQWMDSLLSWTRAM